MLRDSDCIKGQKAEGLEDQMRGEAPFTALTLKASLERC